MFGETKDIAAREAMMEILKSVVESDYSENVWSLLPPEYKQTKVEELLGAILRDGIEIEQLMAMSEKELREIAETCLLEIADVSIRPPMSIK